MKYYITNFSQMRTFTSNCIPISVCTSDPKFFHNNSYNKSVCFVDNKGVLNGIREESFLLPAGVWETLPENCEGCDHTKSATCAFLKAYREHLDTIDFDWLLSEFNRVAEDVRKITHYEGEPIICLLVWEGLNNPCSERWPIKELFAKHGLELIDWKNK